MVKRREVHKSHYSRSIRKKVVSDSSGLQSQPLNVDFNLVYNLRKALHSKITKRFEEENDIQTKQFEGSDRQLQYIGKVQAGRWQTANEQERGQIVNESRIKVRRWEETLPSRILTQSLGTRTGGREKAARAIPSMGYSSRLAETDCDW